MKRNPQARPSHVSEQANDLVISRRSLLKLGVVTLAATGLTTTPALRAGTTPLGFCPITGLSGTSVKLFGPDFGPHLADVSVRLVNGSGYGFVLPLAFEGSELETVLSAVPRTLQDAKFRVVMGEGYYRMPNNMPSQLTLNQPIRTWVGNGGSSCESFQSFSFPWYSAASGNCLNFWGGLSGGQLSIDLVLPFNQDCCPTCPAGTRMSLRFCGSTSGNSYECEYQATLISTTPLAAEHIADALCTLMISAFNTDFPATPDCFQTYIDETRTNITIGAPGGVPFVSGAIQIDLRHDDSSLSGDSIACDSMNQNCDSITPSCPTINVDFVPFIFS